VDKEEEDEEEDVQTESGSAWAEKRAPRQPRRHPAFAGLRHARARRTRRRKQILRNLGPPIVSADPPPLSWVGFAFDGVSWVTLDLSAYRSTRPDFQPVADFRFVSGFRLVASSAKGRKEARPSLSHLSFSRPSSVANVESSPRLSIDRAIRVVMKRSRVIAITRAASGSRRVRFPRKCAILRRTRRHKVTLRSGCHTVSSSPQFYALRAAHGATRPRRVGRVIHKGFRACEILVNHSARITLSE